MCQCLVSERRDSSQDGNQPPGGDCLVQLLADQVKSFPHINSTSWLTDRWTCLSEDAKILEQEEKEQTILWSSSLRRRLIASRLMLSPTGTISISMAGDEWITMRTWPLNLHDTAKIITPKTNGTWTGAIKLAIYTMQLSDY